MPKKITSSSTGPVVLGVGDNPLTITSSGAVTVSGVDATGAGLDAIDGPLPPSPQPPVVWTIRNGGLVASTNGFGMSLASVGTITNTGSISGVDGVALNAGGTVVNQGGGSIVGNVSNSLPAGSRNGAGVFVTGAAGRVTNNAIIKGDAYGVALDLGGTVTNSGSILGGEDGIRVLNAVGKVTNSGTITASLDDGVALFATGTVTNGAGAFISGAGSIGAGVFITGGLGTITNSGSISSGGPSEGVLLSGGGSISNAASATISGGKAAIIVTQGAGTLTNSGHLVATGVGNSVAAVDMEAGGRVANRLGGSINGTTFGVFLTGGVAAVVNSGIISSAMYGAVALPGGGSVTNNVTGTIAGGTSGVSTGSKPLTGPPIGRGTVTNSGVISASGSGGSGVYLVAGGSATNRLGGSIFGVAAGIFANGFSATISNSGSIAGNHAVELQAGGALTNNAGGSIAGVIAGVSAAQAAPVSLTNSGNIFATGVGGAGADLEGGGSVNNTAHGTISGSNYGIFLSGGAGSVTNSGVISGTGKLGVDLAAGGSVTNAAGGVISGQVVGVSVYNGPGTVTNSGTISGVYNAVRFTNPGANRVIVKPTAMFLGNVVATSPGNTMEFAGGTGTITGATGASGTVTENGKSWGYSNFDTLAVDKIIGSSWTFSGANTVQTVLNNGTIAVNGTLDIATAIDPASAGIFLLTGGSLEVAAAIGTTGKMQFLAPIGGTADLIVDDVTRFGNGTGTLSLQSFGLGDMIDLKQFSTKGAVLNYNAGSGVLNVVSNDPGHPQVANLSFQNLGAGTFHAASDTVTGTLTITHS